MKKFKELNEIEKAKLVYSLELGIFGVIFLVVGLLKMLAVLGHNDQVFTWITIFGSAWTFFDFGWFILSKKHRKMSCWIDKALTLPAGIFILTFDIISFATNFQMGENYYRYGIASIFIYISLVFIFESIYHYFYPLPAILEEAEEEAKEKQEQDKQETIEEKKED